MRKLLLLLVCAFVSIGTRASISVWSTTTNGVDGYGIYNWDSPGDIAAFLNGDYQGIVYNGNDADADWKTTLLPLVKAAETVKLGGNADQPKEPIGTADLLALEKLTAVKYLRMDNCFAEEGTDFSQIAVGSTALLDVTLPTGLTKDQVKAANDALKATGVKTTSGITGTVTTEVKNHYWYTVNGTNYEYTGDDAASLTEITVTDMPVMVTLEPVGTNPKYKFTNPFNDNKETYVSGDFGNPWGWGNMLFPNPLEVKLTQRDGKYYYNRKNYESTEEVEYTGDVFTDPDNNNLIGKVENGSSVGQQHAYYLQNGYSTAYQYTYTDTDGTVHVVSYDTSHDGEQVQAGTVSGTFPLSMTTVVTKNLTVDGTTIYVNEAGKLSDVDYMFTNAQNVNLKSSKNVYVLGSLNGTDVDNINAYFNDMVLLDMSDAVREASATDEKIIKCFEGQWNQMRPESALLIPTPENANDLLANQSDLAAFEAGGLKTVGFFTDNTKLKMNVYTQGTSLDKLAPVVDNLYSGTGDERKKIVTSITFTPNYNSDGSVKTEGTYPEVNSSFLTNLAKLDVISVDMTWINISAAGTDFSHLSQYTHYIVLPQNVSNYEAAKDFTGSSFSYSDNIWVVSTYKGNTSPYAQGAAFKSEFYNFSAGVGGFNQTGNLTWIRRAGTLAGAAPYLSDQQKNAQRMVIAGNVGKADLEAMNLVTSKWIDMSVADLVETEVDGNSTLASILHFSNPNVEYLALPDCGVVDEFVPATIKTNCSSLKGLGLYKEAAKNGDAAKENTLYYASWQAGSARTIVEMLPEAQNATGTNARTGMKKYKMWGPLNAADISNQTSSICTASEYSLLGGNATTILSADLSMAWFPTQNDMCMSAAGAYETMTDIELPRTNMTIIPARFMYSCQQVSHICIPDIYTTIKEDAFNLCTRLSQIDVYDVCAKDNNEKDLENVTYNAPVSPYSYKASQHHALIKEVVTNGPQSVTLPASLGHNEGEGLFARSMHINEGIRDVYILATTAPRCQKDAFSSVSYCGNNTYAGPTSHPFGREQYHMGAATLKPEEIDKWIAVLHFPVECTAAERANYTDVTREYSLADETGEVDGDGKPIMWPTQTEFLRSYNQARFGAIWDAWKQNPDRDGQNELTRYGEDYLSDFSSWGNNPGFNQIYTGWHQFVLAANWMYIPEEEEEGEMDYTKTDWYTFCIPFNMTKKQVVELMGVRASTDKFTRTLDGSVVNGDLMPEIRTLTGVTRYPNKQILLHISRDIATMPNDINVGLREASYTASRAYGKDEAGNTLTGDENQIYIKGGYPYLVKAYVPTEMADKVKNLGGFVLARGEFFQSNVGNKYTTVSDGDLQAPYELKVQALAHVGNEEYPIDKDGKKDEMDAGANENAYIYTFVGQYWEQPLPLYSYYLGNSSKGKNFFRATAAAEGSDKWSKWTWNPYVAVIIANGSNSITLPEKSSSGTYTESLSMMFDANDDSFKAAGAKYAFVFDDGISDFDEFETTAINKLDGQEILPLNVKVYNANGQFVGTSVDGLAKGMYIVNGKKFIVK